MKPVALPSHGAPTLGTHGIISVPSFNSAMHTVAGALTAATEVDDNIYEGSCKKVSFGESG